MANSKQRSRQVLAFLLVLVPAVVHSAGLDVPWSFNPATHYAAVACGQPINFIWTSGTHNVMEVAALTDFPSTALCNRSILAERQAAAGGPMVVSVNTTTSAGLRSFICSVNDAKHCTQGNMYITIAVVCLPPGNNASFPPVTFPPYTAPPPVSPPSPPPASSPPTTLSVPPGAIPVGAPPPSPGSAGQARWSCWLLCVLVAVAHLLLLGQLQ